MLTGPFARHVEFRERFNVPGKVEWGDQLDACHATGSSSPIAHGFPPPKAARMRRGLLGGDPERY